MDWLVRCARWTQHAFQNRFELASIMTRDPALGTYVHTLCRTSTPIGSKIMRTSGSPHVSMAGGYADASTEASDVSSRTRMACDEYAVKSNATSCR